MKDAEMKDAALQDMILLVMQRINAKECRLWPWKLKLPQSRLQGIASGIVMSKSVMIFLLPWLLQKTAYKFVC